MAKYTREEWVNSILTQKIKPKTPRFLALWAAAIKAGHKVRPGFVARANPSKSKWILMQA